MYHKVLCLALSPRLDTLIFSTDQGQVLKVRVNLERPYEIDRFEYLIASFHSKSIVALDICLKQNIVATCATDRTVRLWTYNRNHNFQLMLS